MAFVARHGVVLASARHATVPSLAEAIAGAPIRGSWWGHPRGKEIFRALNALEEHADVVFTRLVDGKVTLVHRRLWPALAALVAARRLDPARVAKIEQEHTASGKHVSRTVPFSAWLPADVISRADPDALRLVEAVTKGKR